ncbi:MAG: hypothetical protein MJE63_32105 [Proteobacteria bacterium]|nr:hypothetical protein [Pseudomonadota bacterium]
MTFCTVINCMDGRTQLPVNQHLKEKFKAEYVDTITEPGPNRILAEQTAQHKLESIFQRLEISIKKHHSVGLAIVGHHDCAGNPTTREEQEKHIRKSIDFLKGKYPEIEVLGLWVDDTWQVHEVG